VAELAHPDSSRCVNRSLTAESHCANIAAPETTYHSSYHTYTREKRHGMRRGSASAQGGSIISDGVEACSTDIRMTPFTGSFV
jgi:hypothetical protein